MYERRRDEKSGVLERVKLGELTQVEAGEMLGLSYRHMKRLSGRYMTLGAKGLVHGQVGKPSNHAHPAKFPRRVLVLVKKLYGGDRHWLRSICWQIPGWTWWMMPLA